MHRQPLLVVLRSVEPIQLVNRLKQLDAIGVRHVEIAWSPLPAWSEQCAELKQRFPSLNLGAASVRQVEALEAAAVAGLTYAVSPVLDPGLLQLACQLGITLVPGVLSPSEVYRAQSLGCGLVKLFPASSLGPAYWPRLRAPLGDLPFCIAAGGLAPTDVLAWLSSGVDAVALGGTLDYGGTFDHDKAWQSLRELVLALGDAALPLLPEQVISQH
ncbi:bifunctional 4-hydroxy-2-oxoglutarate aldolase/2-dehydro-3-deoxy-phosphogluconate aldolase [Cyanobium sp. HWJ4-Hawea]|nr:bifunctional 4-hydroxy-2-oxoglutarate aldolase/2-dehydro-3-deoxy-phosphogluconate aldolase [Cyanobium sp. HWJ4-Hawea]